MGRRFGFGASSIRDRFEDHPELRIHLRFELIDPAGEVVAGGDHLAHVHEGAHDVDPDLRFAWAVEDRRRFLYDDADRLLSIAYKKTDGTPIETISYTYDAKGQRLSKTSGSASTRETAVSATYDPANRLATLTLAGTGETFTLTYDDNGNLAQKQGAASGTTMYTWDSRNRLTQITSPTTTATFQYDGLGRRVARTVNGSTTQYVYDGPQAIGEITNGRQSHC
ncbi:MAG: repeat-associated core domain protein [Betaproteobacteria bacterium]|nr:repeat-associated core domain protein [Betaproteobacteria bacterium]